MASIIEFNGKKYDTVTGRVIPGGDSHKPSSVNNVIKPSKQSTNRIVKSTQESKKVSSTKSKIEVKTEQKSEKKVSKSKRIVQSNNNRNTEKSQTLMRPALKKPKYVSDGKHKPPTRVKLYKELTRERARRAQTIATSTHIKKFHKGSTKSKLVKSAQIAVKSPAKHAHVSTKKTVRQEPHLTDKFTEALHSAESHLEVFTEEKLHSKKTRRLTFATASIMSVFLIGFAVYQAVPFVRIKLASDKAGFSASLPSYSPSGFSLSNNLEADSGEVTLAYNSRTNDQNYKITETPSEWNSESLLNNYIVASNKQFQRLEDKGRTIFLYDDSSATWLDNGVWYRLEGNASLSNDQLLKIVNGL